MKYKQQLIVLTVIGVVAGCSEKKDIDISEQETFTVWQYIGREEDTTKLQKTTRFQLTFTKHVVNENSNPFDPTQLPGENQKWFGIKLEAKNIGSKWSPINYDCFVRMKDGSEYRLAPWIEGNKSFAAFAPEQAGVIQLTCRIQKQATPVEVFGLFGAAIGNAGATKFTCRLH